MTGRPGSADDPWPGEDHVMRSDVQQQNVAGRPVAAVEGPRMTRTAL